MNFKAFDTKMRQYETRGDKFFFQEENLVIRLDGRGFSGLTDKLQFTKPFDEQFNEMMGRTVKYLMQETGVLFTYGYHQSDEISLLLSTRDRNFDRKERKMLSILASAAGAAFTAQLYLNGYNTVATFDARVSVLPKTELVLDYFRWRQEDAVRNALSGYAYWTLRQNGFSTTKATNALSGLGKDGKNELLFGYGINFNDVTPWHKRGVGFTIDKEERIGYNPKTEQEVKVLRNTLVRHDDLPYGEEYDSFLLRRIWADSPTGNY